jgi:hypothetical protein
MSRGKSEGVLTGEGSCALKALRYKVFSKKKFFAGTSGN